MAQDNPPFIQLSGPGAPKPPAGARIPVPPPPPPFPPTGARVPQKQAAPKQQGQKQHPHPQAGPVVHHHPPAHQPAIQPPNAMVPPQYRERPSIYYSDIRRERMSDADARERLSSWIIQRFEKIIDEEYDEAGYALPPTWENVIRTEVKDMSKAEASRRVRYLEDTSKPVAEKKASLSPAQQRQLELAQEQLQRAEPDQRYCYELIQIDHQLKKLDRRQQQYYEDSKRLQEGKKVTIGRRRRSSSSSRSKDRKKKPLYERISLTAYFRRAPRIGEKVHIMLQEREELSRRRSMPPMQPHPHVMQQMMQQAHAHQGQHQHPHPHPHPHQGQPLPAVRPGQNKGQKPQILEIRNGRNNVIIRDGSSSPRSSRSSGYSEGSSSYDSDSDYTTPNSSVDSADSSHRHRRRRHRSRSRHRPEQFGIDRSSRRHSRHEQHFITDSHPMRIPGVLPQPPTPPPMMLQPTVDIEALEHEAFRAGQMDERARALEEAAIAGAYRPRTAPRPHIIQRRSSMVRLVEPREATRERLEDAMEHLDRLQLEDEVRFENQRRREEELEDDRRDAAFHRRMALEQRMRRERQEYDALALEDEAMFEDRAAREYMRRRDRELLDRPARGGFDREPRVQFENPFTPMGARPRRYSTYNM